MFLGFLESVAAARAPFLPAGNLDVDAPLLTASIERFLVFCSDSRVDAEASVLLDDVFLDAFLSAFYKHKWNQFGGYY